MLSLPRLSCDCGGGTPPSPPPVPGGVNPSKMRLYAARGSRMPVMGWSAAL